MSLVHAMLSLVADPCELVLSSLKELLKDKVLSLTTPHACSSRESAALLLEWCSADANRAMFENFAARIVHALLSCMCAPSEAKRPENTAWEGVGHSSLHTNEHRVLCSLDWILPWGHYGQRSPFQRLTDVIFRKLLQYLYAGAVLRDVTKLKFRGRIQGMGDTLDRGGLNHVTEDMYSVLVEGIFIFQWMDRILQNCQQKEHPKKQSN